MKFVKFIADVAKDTMKMYRFHMKNYTGSIS